MVCCAAVWLAREGRVRGTAAEGRTGVRVARIYSGADGQTHAEEIEAGFGAADALGLEQSERVKAESVNFSRFRPGFFQDWHHATARRYVITLSGQGEIELGSGQRIALEPGHILLAEDMSGKGHITRNVGKADWTAMFVQVEEEGKK
jgi:quercetin dioxygenase-like cupin family protein